MEKMSGTKKLQDHLFIQVKMCICNLFDKQHLNIIICKVKALIYALLLCSFLYTDYIYVHNVFVFSSHVLNMGNIRSLLLVF